MEVEANSCLVAVVHEAESILSQLRVLLVFFAKLGDECVGEFDFSSKADGTEDVELHVIYTVHQHIDFSFIDSGATGLVISYFLCQAIHSCQVSEKNRHVELLSSQQEATSRNEVPVDCW